MKDTTTSLDDLSVMAGQVGRIYAQRFDIDRDGTFYLGKLTEELGEVAAAYLKLVGKARVGERSQEELRSDLQDELADLFGFLLLFSQWQGVDLGAALVQKWGSYLDDKDDT